MVFDAVDAFAEEVVLEVEDLEAGEDVLDEGGDAQGEIWVAQRDCVGGQAAEFLGEIDEGEEVFLNGDVEGIAVLEVDGNWEGISKGLGGGDLRGVPLRSSPTSSMVTRRPSSPGLVSVPRPPSQPQKTTVKMVF